jgi:hypothetical protein
MTSATPWDAPSPVGRFTGLDWSDAAVTARFDPAIAWIEWIGLAGRGLQPNEPLPVLLEFEGGAAFLQDLHGDNLAIVPPAYRAAGPNLRFCTAYVRLDVLAHLPPQILRVGLGLAANPRPMGSRPWSSWVAAAAAQIFAAAPVSRAAEAQEARPPRHVMAVIDDGCAFAHAHFRAPSTAGPGLSRVVGLWDQGRTRLADRRTPWTVPAAMAYGLELDSSAISALMQAASAGDECNESACYFAAGIEVPPPITGAYLHGTHVLDLAAGHPDPTRSDRGADAASQAELLFVQMPSEALHDSAGGWLAFQLLDALRYVVANTEPQDRVVVNVSLAAQAGPHDGTTLIERAMDHLLEFERPHNLHIVLAAGNGYKEDGHRRMVLAPGERRGLDWSVAEGDATDSFLEIWLPPERPADESAYSDILIRVRAPGAAEPSKDMRPGDVLALGASALAIYAQSSICGNGRRLFLLALTPTRSALGYAQAAPAGDWGVDLINAAASPAEVHAWIERDGERRELWSGLGQPWIGKQSSFASPGDEADRQTTLGSLACGARTIVVGAADRAARPVAASPFTAAGPALPPSQRPGPDLSAPGSDSGRDPDGIVAAQGIGTVTAARRGTSMAAPIVAREVLNLLARAPRPLDRDEVVDGLLQGANPTQNSLAATRLGRGTIGLASSAAPTTAPEAA